MSRNHLATRKRIQQAVSKLATGAQRRYPAKLRASIADYCRQRVEAGVPLTRVSSEISVSHPTLVRILGEKPAPMRRVRVARPKPTMTAPVPPLVVRCPGGLVIEGLDVEAVAALIRGLS